VKNLLKLFLIFLSFFIIPGLNSCGANLAVNMHSQIISSANDEIKFVTDNSENSIIASNSHNYEIISFNENKDSSGNCPIYKSNFQNKLTQQFLNLKYNQLFISNSHKISSYLKNEICTRAP